MIFNVLKANFCYQFIYIIYNSAARVTQDKPRVREGPSGKQMLADKWKPVVYVAVE